MEVSSFSWRDDNFIITIPIAFGPTVSLFKIALHPVFGAKCKFFNQ